MSKISGKKPTFSKLRLPPIQRAQPCPEASRLAIVIAFGKPFADLSKGEVEIAKIMDSGFLAYVRACEMLRRRSLGLDNNGNSIIGLHYEQESPTSSD